MNKLNKTVLDLLNHCLHKVIQNRQGIFVALEHSYKKPLNKTYSRSFQSLYAQVDDIKGHHQLFLVLYFILYFAPKLTTTSSNIDILVAWRGLGISGLIKYVYPNCKHVMYASRNSTFVLVLLSASIAKRICYLQ